MKDPNVEALKKRTRMDTVCSFVFAGVFAFTAVGKLLMHSAGTAVGNLFLCVIFLLTGLIFTDIRRHGKPFAMSVIRKLRVLAVTVMCSGFLSDFAESFARSKALAEPLELNLDDRFIIVTALLGVIIGILSEIFVYGHALQKDMDQIA